MKGFFFLGLSFFMALSIAIPSAQAGFQPPSATRPDPGSLPGQTGVYEGRSLIDAVSLTINWALGFLGIVVFCLFLFAGFTYATAGGEEKKAELARKTMINTVIGMIIIFLSFVLSNAVLGFVFDRPGTGGGTNDGTNTIAPTSQVYYPKV